MGTSFAGRMSRLGRTAIPVSSIRAWRPSTKWLRTSYRIRSSIRSDALRRVLGGRVHYDAFTMFTIMRRWGVPQSRFLNGTFIRRFRRLD